MTAPTPPPAPTAGAGNSIVGAEGMNSLTLPGDCTEILHKVGHTGEFFIAIAFLALLFSVFVFLMMTFKADLEKRKYYYINLFISGVTTLVYFAMMSGQGFMVVRGCREEFAIRYWDWAITFPLILFELSLIAGVDETISSSMVGANVLMVVAFYAGSVSVSRVVKWCWFFIAISIGVPIAYTLIRVYRPKANAVHSTVADLYAQALTILIASWCFYSLVWILCAGFEALSVNIEVISYAIIDVLTKSVLGFCVLKSNEALERTQAGSAGYKQVSSSSQIYGAAESAF